MKDLKKLRKIIQSIHLSEEEKMSGRNEFLAFMEKNPIDRELHESGFTQLLRRFYALTRRPMAATATLLGVFVVTASGISYAAESSVPGDVLYPFKVRVNEEVQGFFHFNSKSKAQWEVDRIQRRLEEVETLKDEGKLDVKTKHEFKQELNINTKAMEEHVNELRAEGEEEAAAEIESSFDTLFEVHEEAAMDIEFEIIEWEPKVEPEAEIETKTEGGIEENPTGEEEPETKIEGETEVTTEVETTVEVTPIELETEIKIDTGIDPTGLKLPLEKRIS